MSKHLFPVSVFAFVLSVTAIPALAADATNVGTETASLTVRYRDLDLSKSDDAALLLNRIEYAAASVCGPKPRIFEVAANVTYEACVSAATKKAVADVGSPLLASLAAGTPVTLAQQ